MTCEDRMGARRGYDIKVFPSNSAVISILESSTPTLTPIRKVLNRLFETERLPFRSVSWMYQAVSLVFGLLQHPASFTSI